MSQLEDLDDDCLSKVLDRLPADQLFKLLGVNKRMKRLAEELIRTKIKAIAFEGKRRYFTDCRSHLGAIRQDQVLFLESLFKNDLADESSKQAFFSSVFSKCPAVKCLDTYNGIWSKPMPDGLFIEVVRCCPELECLKLQESVVSEDDLDLALQLIGHRIVHLAKYESEDDLSANQISTDVRMLKTVAKKCPNIKRVDWQMMSGYLISGLVAAFKLLPTNCWITFKSKAVFESFDIEFEDVVDELITKNWNWSHFGQIIIRLSSLKFSYINQSFDFSHGPVVRGIEFLGLKKLEIAGCLKYDDYLVGCLVTSQFPQLEEFRFNVSRGFTEGNFEAIFQNVKSIKKLTFSWGSDALPGVEPLLPGLAINHLKQLETIEFDIWTFPNTWKLDVFLQQLEQYVDEIRSLKKLTFKIWDRGSDGWKEPVKEKVEQLKKKQNRVEVDFMCRK